MKPTRTIAVSALAGLAALAGAIGIGTSAGASLNARDGIHVVAHEDLGLTVIPCDTCVLTPYGFQPGDHIGEFRVYQGTLTNIRGKTAGHWAMHVLGTTVATNGPPEVQLTGTLSLPDGQITVQGLEEPPTNAGTIAITGGTGRYQRARGELRFHDIDDLTTDMTIDIR